MYLAELDNNNRCIGVKMVNGMINDGKHVELSSLTVDVIGKKYDEISGTFIEIPKDPEQERQEQLNILKTDYLQLIRDAKDLGEDDEVLRLQQEYQQKKTEIESQED